MHSGSRNFLYLHYASAVCHTLTYIKAVMRNNVIHRKSCENTLTLPWHFKDDTCQVTSTSICHWQPPPCGSVMVQVSQVALRYQPNCAWAAAAVGH